MYQISGTPASTGTAGFAIGFGGQSCTLSLPVGTDQTDTTSNIFDFTVVPNPVKDLLKVKFAAAGTQAYYVWIYDAVGRTMLMLPQPDLSAGIPVNFLSKGTYMIRVMEASEKKVLTKKFIKG